MKRTPLENYFSDDVANSLKSKMRISCMEQLISITKDQENLFKIPELIGIDHNRFVSILNRAKKSIKNIPKRSRRKYPLGARSKSTDQIAAA